MHANDNRPESADVVAVFEDQLDADEALLQLRVAGFRDNQIGYYHRNVSGGITNLLNRDYEFVGAVLGGVAGAALGVGVALVLSDWWAATLGVRDLFGLSVTCAVFGALLIGFLGAWIGMSYSRRALPAPAMDPGVGPLILEVAAGDARDEAWAIIKRNGGHEPPPGTVMAHPGAV